MKSRILATWGIGLVAVACHAASITDPIPYKSASDTPDGFYPSSEFTGQDFENPDGPWEVGFTFSSGMRIGPKHLSGDGVPVTDSVDLDDGELDGDGTMGASWYTPGQDLMITFAQPVSIASFAFTDTDTRTNFINVTALAADDRVLAERSFESFVDDVFTGTTDEDRFIGITADAGESIAKLLIGIDQGLGIEVDHVQFSPVPEPHSLMLLSFAGLFVGKLRRRRR